MRRLQDIRILPQPDDSTCGPTCLHAIYRYYGDSIPIGQVIREVPSFKEGGTLAVMLGCHALKQNYTARIFTYNLQVFDPMWFRGRVNLAGRLKRQMEFKRNRKLRIAAKSYLEFLELGGKVSFEDLTPSLFQRYLNRSIPILTGLSATYLYRAAREFGADGTADTIRGEPQGHFVILCGYDKKRKKILVADPFKRNPYSRRQTYAVPANRVIGAILLGILTYDANLLILEPRARRRR